MRVLWPDLRIIAPKQSPMLEGEGRLRFTFKGRAGIDLLSALNDNVQDESFPVDGCMERGFFKNFGQKATYRILVGLILVLLKKAHH